jgi:hypothetical protein
VPSEQGWLGHILLNILGRKEFLISSPVESPRSILPHPGQGLEKFGEGVASQFSHRIDRGLSTGLEIKNSFLPSMFNRICPSQPCSDGTENYLTMSDQKAMLNAASLSHIYAYTHSRQKKIRDI